MTHIRNSAHIQVWGRKGDGFAPFLEILGNPQLNRLPGLLSAGKVRRSPEDLPALRAWAKENNVRLRASVETMQLTENKIDNVAVDLAMKFIGLLSEGDREEVVKRLGIRR